MCEVGLSSVNKENRRDGGKRDGNVEEIGE